MPITLDVLGELVRQLQAEVRSLRAEVTAVRSERSEMLATISDLLLAGERRVMDRLAAFEAHIDTRLDRA